MYRAVVVLVLFALPLAVAFAAGYAVGLRRKPPITEQSLRITEHSRLLAQSREAHMRGDLVLADIYDQAAARVFEED